MVKFANPELLPVKAHYFFFFAALGPLLPQLNVFGRQLGVSPEVMGLVTAVLPLLWAIAKPCFGYLVDYFTNQRKLIFMLLILTMSSSYCGLWFLPEPQSSQPTLLKNLYQLNGTVYLKHVKFTSNIASMPLINKLTAANDIELKNKTDVNAPNKTEFGNIEFKKKNDLDVLNNEESKNYNEVQKYKCFWDCTKTEQFIIFIKSNPAKKVNVDTFYINDDITKDTCTKFSMDFIIMDKELECRVRNNCDLMCEELELNNSDNIINSIDKNNKFISNNTKEDESVIKSTNSVDQTNKLNNHNIKVDEIVNKSANSIDKNNKLNNNNIKDDETVNKSTTVDNSNDEKTDFISDNNVGDKISENVNKSINNMHSVTASFSTIPNNAKTAQEDGNIFYGTVTFWAFVILICLGTVAFNVANCISDAICFDVLGVERSNLYGNQRAWGTAGYGITACLGGWLVDRLSSGAHKNFTPAFALAAAFTVLDLFSCRRLTLPQLTSAEGGGAGALRAVLRCPRVLLFIVFAVVAGMFDSFIIYYMFWYIEELADEAGGTANVKLLEGVIVFGQSFVGELIFFFLSGRILERFGHGKTLTFCLLCYGARLAFVSLVTNPWYLVPIEAIMQGPTYALCYATIVGYAAAVAPEGHSATMQGIVAGMDDGVGFALGSLLGGQLYGYMGGCSSFRIMALIALGAGGLHALLNGTVLADSPLSKARVASESIPAERQRMLEKSAHVLTPLRASGNVYCDTVVPLNANGEKATGMINVRYNQEVRSMPSTTEVEDAVTIKFTSETLAVSGNPADQHHLGKMVLKGLKEHPDAINQIDGGTGESETNGSVLLRSTRLSSCMRQCGLRRGDVIALLAPNHIHACVPFYAALYLGVAVTPVDRTAPIQDLARTFENSKPKIIFCQSEKAADIQKALNQLDMDSQVVTFNGVDNLTSLSDFMKKYADEDYSVDMFEATEFDGSDTTAFIITTSGSTGLPKSAATTHKNFAFSTSLQILEPSPMLMISSPLQWLSSIYIFLLGVICKCPRLQTSSPLNQQHCYELINMYRPTALLMSPNMITTLLKMPDRLQCDFTCFKAIFLGGSFVPIELMETLKKLSGAQIRNSYAMTETTGPVFLWDDTTPSCSTGKPIGYLQYRLINLATEEDIEEPFTQGELLLRGSSIFKEYYNNAKATAAAFTEDGWFRTGDIFYRDAIHNYFYVDRMSLLFKYKTSDNTFYKISPFELESVIRSHEDVEDAVVTYVPHPEQDNLAVACVVRRAGSTLTALNVKDVVKMNLPDWKHLHGGVIFLEELPVTSTTKVDRMRIRELAANTPRE